MGQEAPSGNSSQDLNFSMNREIDKESYCLAVCPNIVILQGSSMAHLCCKSVTKNSVLHKEESSKSNN